MKLDKNPNVKRREEKKFNLIRKPHAQDAANVKKVVKSSEKHPQLTSDYIMGGLICQKVDHIRNNRGGYVKNPY